MSGTTASSGAGTGEFVCYGGGSFSKDVYIDGIKISGGYLNGNVILSDDTFTSGAGTQNTIIGLSALLQGTSADKNNALGYSALGGVTTGDNNIGIGYNMALFKKLTILRRLTRATVSILVDKLRVAPRPPLTKLS